MWPRNIDHGSIEIFFHGSFGNKKAFIKKSDAFV